MRAMRGRPARHLKIPIKRLPIYDLQANQSAFLANRSVARLTNVLFRLTEMARLPRMTRKPCEPGKQEIPYPNIKANRKLPKS